MKKINLAIILLSLMGTLLWCQSVETSGHDILVKSDLAFYPKEGTYDMNIVANSAKGQKTTYDMQIYKSGKEKQTVVWVSPEVMKNTVSIRNGDTIFYKPLKAFRPDIMSYQALFLNSGFAWGDVVSADLSSDYKAVAVNEVKLEDKDCYFIQLSPLSGNRYSRIDVWIDKSTNFYLRRLYYSASGTAMKQADFTVLDQHNGKAGSFRIDIDDLLMGSKSSAVITKIAEKKIPAFILDVNNIGRIHVQ